MDKTTKANYEYLIVCPSDASTADNQLFQQIHQPLPSLATARVVIGLIQKDWDQPLCVVTREKKTN